jgi:dihydropteroate synthase
MVWRIKNRDIDLTTRALVMGILNVTLDSFSDGGKYAQPDRAVEHALDMAAQGADIIDVGGESTRPGAEPVAAEVEMERVLPVIEGLSVRLGVLSAQCSVLGSEGECRDAARSESKIQNPKSRIFPPLISIDTCKPAVAAAAIARGASIINDVTGLRDDAMIEVAARTGAGVIAMHMQGTPRDMQRDPHYENVVAEVGIFFRQIFDRAIGLGLDPMSFAFDPGIGFGKTVAHNLSLLKNLAALRVADRPLVVGVSRKSFIGKLTGSAAMEDRLAPTVALTSLLRARGANVLRVHDVRPNVHALRVAEAIMEAPC